MNKVIAYYKKIIYDLTISNQTLDIVHYEVKLLSMVLGPIIAVASLLNIVLGIVWEFPLYKVTGLSIILFTCAMIIIHVSGRRKISNNFKLHMISILFMIAIYFVFLMYYEKIGILFWFILIMVTMFANISSGKILFLYMTILYAVLYISSLLLFDEIEIVMNMQHNLLLLFMLALIITISFVVKQLYSLIMNEKLNEYRFITDKNSEITSLYEEIVASEEELKEQNEKLQFYNAEISANKEKLEYLAYNDTLTGLPNRKMLIEQLNYMVESGRCQGRSFSVVFIDLDNFKKINDSMGHAAGDALLVQVSGRLQTLVHKSDLLGRLGGDELALLIRRSLTGEALFTYVQEMCDLFDNSFMLDNVHTKVTASFGIAVYPDDAETADDLLKAADTAMYKAKEVGKNNIQFYHIDMKNEILARINLENLLLQALKQDEFYMVYQPIFDTKTKKVCCFEALLRWKTKDQRIIPPSEFIPFAEEIGLINEIGERVLNKVCSKLKELKQNKSELVRIAVNISAIQMKQVSFVDDVMSIIQGHGISPELLEFEITESVFINEKELAVEKINKLKAYGIDITMDDFGTGYSSLSYLLELPIDKLKIDRAFIKSIEQGNKKRDIIGSIIDMVHSLGIKAVAEGVENTNQLEYLDNGGCDMLQGFLMGVPMEEALLEGVLNPLQEYVTNMKMTGMQKK